MRCLNSIYSVGEPGRFDPDKFGDPEKNRVVGSYQADELKDHFHSIDGVWTTNKKGGTNPNPEGWAQNSESTQTNPSGGIETRPRNVALYFYLKVN